MDTRLIIIVILLIVLMIIGIYYHLHTPYTNIKCKPYNICVIMTGDHKIKSFYQLTSTHNRQFSHRKGYDFDALLGRRLSSTVYAPHYDRYQIFLDKFNKNYQYVFYIDSDAIFYDYSQKIEDYISIMESNRKSILASVDCVMGGSSKINRKLPLNSGVLLMKNNQTTRNLCHSVLASKKCRLQKTSCGTDNKSYFFDQCVLEGITSYHKDFHLVDFGILQKFAKWKCYQSKESRSHKGFVFHTPGLNLSDKISNLRAKISEAEKDNLKNSKISVIILNYNRPHNLKKSLPVLVQYHKIGEIVVLHGHPKFYNDSFKHPKVKHVKDFKNNTKFGTARRWFYIEKCSYDYVLILDDDLIPDKKFIDSSYKSVIKYNTLVGHSKFQRTCNKNGYFLKDDKHINMVLVGASIIPKHLGVKYMVHLNGFSKYRSWLVKHHGNCEDLAFNMFVLKVHKIAPIILKQGHINDLDNSLGYSSKKNHLDIRKKFCQNYG